MSSDTYSISSLIAFDRLIIICYSTFISDGYLPHRVLRSEPKESRLQAGFFVRINSREMVPKVGHFTLLYLKYLCSGSAAYHIDQGTAQNEPRVQFTHPSAPIKKRSRRCIFLWVCRRWDSNPQSLRNTVLSRARIPIPPLRHDQAIACILSQKT